MRDWLNALRAAYPLKVKALCSGGISAGDNVRCLPSAVVLVLMVGEF